MGPYRRAAAFADELGAEVERTYAILHTGLGDAGEAGDAPILADPALRRQAEEQIRELRAALRRFRHALSEHHLARMGQGRADRAAEDGRGSGPLPLGFRLGDLDAERSRKGARGARWEVVLDPDGVRVVRRIFALRDEEHLTAPSAIAVRLYEEVLGMPRRRPRLRDERAAQEAEAEGDAGRAADIRVRSTITFLTAARVQAILDREELYRTGRRVWSGVEATVRWPIVLAPDE
jgi:hypothetical protein